MPELPSTNTLIFALNYYDNDIFCNTLFKIIQ